MKVVFATIVATVFLMFATSIAIAKPVRHHQPRHERLVKHPKKLDLKVVIPASAHKKAVLRAKKAKKRHW
jgi:hypothetical protein